MTRGRCAPRAPAIVGAVCAALVWVLCAVPLARAGWSAPASPPGCAAALATPEPLVVFPSAGPLVRSGPGALLWTAPRGCSTRDVGVGGAAETLDATLGADDLPGPGRALVPAAGGLATVTAAAGTAAGDVLTVGASGAAAVSGYLGDAVLASPVRSPRGGWELAVRAQRHYSSVLGRPRLVPAGAGPVTAVAAALDYRAETLLVWAARGSVYACELPAAGPAGPVRRLGPAGADPELGALLSDDGHAIVVWRSFAAAPTEGFGSSSAARVGGASASTVGGGGASRVGGAGASTTIELSLFQTGPGTTLEPGSLRQVERFSDPPGFPLSPGSLRLIRLSSEAVMLAWTGLFDGHYVVRASPVSLRRGAWAPVTISPATAARGDDAVLADLVPGPAAEALALWSTWTPPAVRCSQPTASGDPRGARPLRGARGSRLRSARTDRPARPQRTTHGGVRPADRSRARRLGHARRRSGPRPACLRAARCRVRLDPSARGRARRDGRLPVGGRSATARSATARAAPADGGRGARARSGPQAGTHTCGTSRLRPPYASIDSSAIRIGTPLAACLK